MGCPLSFTFPQFLGVIIQNNSMHSRNLYFFVLAGELTIFPTLVLPVHFSFGGLIWVPSSDAMER